MSQQEGINITKSNIYNICDLKCAYSYYYQESNILIAKNNEINLSLNNLNIKRKREDNELIEEDIEVYRPPPTKKRKFMTFDDDDLGDYF